MRNNSSEQYTFRTQMHEVVEIEKVVGTTDHTLLQNLDAPDQHPISSIIGLQEILDELRNNLKPPEPVEPDLNPTVIQPEVILELGGSGATAFEVGKEVNVVYNARLEPGSYSYGPETGITASGWQVTDTAGNTAASAFGSFNVAVAEGEKYVITATAAHGDGAIPVTSLGNEHPEGQIKAGTKSATAEMVIAGYRKSFYGTTTDKEEITSDIIRSLSGQSNGALENGTTFDVPVPVGAMRVIIAYPATLQDLSSVKDTNCMNMQIVSAFNQTTLAVEGANGYEAVDYKIYVQNFAVANDTANTYTITI